jgi:ABC-type multidrug transport system ATPase subunit
MDAVVIKDLRKVYANGVEALKGIDLTVREGDFFALLGPNGAGKTTAIGIVTSLIRKSGGSVTVFGRAPIRSATAATNSSTNSPNSWGSPSSKTRRATTTCSLAPPPSCSAD